MNLFNLFCNLFKSKPKPKRIPKTYDVGKAIATIVEVVDAGTSPRKWTREFIGSRKQNCYYDSISVHCYYRTLTARKIYEAWLKESFTFGIIGVNSENTIFLPSNQIKEITVEYINYEITE